jgi:hypothetical protein
MSRAEGIAACTNIVELVEQMDDKLPDTFSSSVDDKAKSMLDYIMKSPQYPRVTDKMDQALRNMWGGLQKWNRNSDFNDNLFDGVEGVIKELQSVQSTYDKAEGGEESSNDAEDEGSVASDTAPTLGLEEMSDDLPHYAAVKDTQDKGDRAREARLQKQNHNSAAPTINVIKGEDVKKVLSQPVNITKTGLPLEDIIKVREELVSRTLNQVHDAYIRVIDDRSIRHGSIDEVLKASKSDRTHQLIKAAYYAGKISGITQLGEELSTEAGKK